MYKYKDRPRLHVDLRVNTLLPNHEIILELIDQGFSREQ